MGIRNFSGETASAGDTLSLPLMGIRNFDACILSRLAVCRSSLPLMGIRNLADIVDALARTGSLPLMGIRNRRGVVQFDPPPSRLITPHGDSKHDWVSPAGCDGVRILITPHGDSKLARLDGRPLRGRPHYPSWGFETVATMPVSVLSSALITPHGDSKPGRARPCRRLTLGAHYPSWGFETSRTMQGPSPMLVSLPLMGIRNSAATATNGNSIRRLITPHGDSKHLAAGMDPDQELLLITPHGDSKRSGATDCPQPAGAHYPSWGFETRSRPCSHAPPRSHYPSWGFETRGDPEVLHPLPEALITPHGDSKHDLSVSLLDDRDVVLITPHGDSKPSRSPPYSQAHRSHYPSWGFETPRPGTRSPAGTTPHYPSWGFETRCRRGRTRRRPRLITPHGDSKLHDVDDADVGTTRAHYPSWGFETCQKEQQHSLRPQAPHYPSWGFETATLTPVVSTSNATSLPLMGIRNVSCSAAARARRTSTHYPSWGFETCERHDDDDDDRHAHLITPHGDSKLYVSVPFVPRRRVLITPHGDSKRHLCRVLTPGRPGSLPLMGIRNRREIFLVVQGGDLITPHGDSKPLTIS